MQKGGIKRAQNYVRIYFADLYRILSRYAKISIYEKLGGFRGLGYYRKSFDFSVLRQVTRHVRVKFVLPHLYSGLCIYVRNHHQSYES